jgi:hypothetical protein
MAPPVTGLTRQPRVTRRSILQKVRRHSGSETSPEHRAPTERKRRVSGLFHPPCGALFTFPSRYLCTIGHRKYLAFDGGPPSFPANSTCWLVLRCRTREHRLSATGLSPTLAGRPRRVRLACALVTRSCCCRARVRSYNPGHAKPAGICISRFRLVPVRSPLLREYFPFLGVREMFQFPRSPLPRLCVQRGVSRHDPAGVAPFGDLRLWLPAPDRSLSQRCHVLHRLATPRHPPCALTCWCLVLTPLRAAVPRMGPERERVRKQRRRAQGCGRSPPARSDRSTLVSFFMSTIVCGW